MDYEKKYKDALSIAKGIHSYSSDIAEIKRMEEIFPELAESEDEKNIKDLIDELKCSLRAANCQNEACGGGHEKRIAILEWAIAWLEKQGKEKYLSEPIKDYQGSFACWNNAHDFRPKHLQRCICYDKYMKGIYCYVYDDISKYWCTQTTEEHDPDGDNHISDYADYRVPVWMPLPDISFYPLKSWLEKQGEKKQEESTLKCEPFRIKKGEWYVCIHDFCNKAIRIGEIIQAEHDDTIRGFGFLYMENKYFRPAFENEIPQKTKWTEEDEHHWMMCLECVEECATQEREDFSKTIDWLKSIKKMKEQ